MRHNGKQQLEKSKEIHTRWATQTVRKELQSNKLHHTCHATAKSTAVETTMCACAASHPCASRHHVVRLFAPREGPLADSEARNQNLESDSGSKANSQSLARTACQPPTRRECSDRRGSLATKSVINQLYAITCSCLRVTSTSARRRRVRKHFFSIETSIMVCRLKRGGNEATWAVHYFGWNTLIDHPWKSLDKRHQWNNGCRTTLRCKSLEKPRSCHQPQRWTQCWQRCDGMFWRRGKPRWVSVVVSRVREPHLRSLTCETNIIITHLVVSNRAATP